MAGELLQDVVVTVVMLGAVATVARRVLGFAAIRDSVAGKPSAGCDKCAMAPMHHPQASGASAAAARPSGVTVHPLVVLRKPTSSRTTSA
jgi:hypothetical protein